MLVFGSALQAQDKKIDALMRIKPEVISAIKIDSNLAIYLPMPFSQAVFSDFSQLNYIKDVKTIYGIDLVYTRFKEVDSFSQPKLNLHRFKELKKIYPQAFNEPDIHWRVLEQREAKTKEAAEKCFHGFVIYLKNIMPDSITKNEVNTIIEILNSYHDTMIWIPEKIDYKIKRVKVETGVYLPRSEKKRKEGITYKTRGIWNREPQTYTRKDSIIRKKSGGYFQKVGKFDTSLFRSTAEYKMLTRRKWSTKMAVVADVTGSMTPYSTQVMLWLKYNPDILAYGRFTFFNDGDNIPDLYKKIGKTGGIYFSKSQNFDSVYNVMVKAMSRGQGGDLPENNMEAVKETLKMWPDTDTILLIADNSAPVKDLMLLKNLKIPISVMCCGVTNRINPDYINIVNTTGGKLFVLEHELQNLKGLKNGNRITIGDAIFEYQKGALFKIK